MSDQILGLVSGKTFATNSFHNRNHRRRIFHDCPTGAAPLTGLLSLLATETVESPDFGWHEKRYVEPTTLTVDFDGSHGPLMTTPGTPADPELALTAPAGGASGTLFWVKVASEVPFRLRHVVQLAKMQISGATTRVDVQGVVIELDKANHYIKLRYTGASDVTIDNAETINAALNVIVVGNANAEGTTSTTGRMVIPIKPTNYTQIFRNAFSLTRTASKIPTDFDKSGIYKEQAKDNALDHMTEMEKAFLFGEKSMTYVEDPIDLELLPERTTGGVLHFMREYEAADSMYRGGTGAPAIVSNDDDDKRILNALGTISPEVFDSYVERAFRVTNNQAFEKLMLCGNKFLASINTYIKSATTTNKDMTAQSVYGFNVLTWESPFGTIHFKTHPLFNRNKAWLSDAILLDVQNLRFRPLADSDTTLLKNRQRSDQDRRKDEWLTEAGLECRMPESHMYFQGLDAIS